MDKSYMDKSYIVYIIYKDKYSYVGTTNDAYRRIRQHNGEICGGAKYTTSKGDGWDYACLITGFKSQNDALKFEWALKHNRKYGSKGIYSRIKNLKNLLFKENWTKSSPNSKNYELDIEWFGKYKSNEEFKKDLPEYIKSN